MSVYLSKKFATPEEFEAWIAENEHENKSFLDNLCEQDKQKWDSKACKMTVKDGKLQLLCENNNVLAEADYYIPDEKTVCCDGNGKVCVKGIENANDKDGKKFRVWVGTREEYFEIRVKDPTTIYWVTDDTSYDDIIYAINALNTSFKELEAALTNGNIQVRSSIYSAEADVADVAKRSLLADNATMATTAKKADNATNADSAKEAESCPRLKNELIDGTVKVGSATYADNATNDSSGNKFEDTYGNFARNWNSSFMSNFVNLDGAGVYLFSVVVGAFKASTLVYFDGKSETVSMLNVVVDSAYGLRAYRLHITTGGKATVQKATIDTESINKNIVSMNEYSDIEYKTGGDALSINAKKIF